MTMDTFLDLDTKPVISQAPATGTPPTRGFAGMTPEQHRAMASTGGKKAHALKRAHRFSSEEARRAGRVGGMVVSKNREHMAAIGRKGGRSRKTGDGASKVQPQPDRVSDLPIR
jgi:general stress protein YciG